MAISDDKQRVMPLPEDLSNARCQQLAYKEAVLLLNPVNKALQGEVSTNLLGFVTCRFCTYPNECLHSCGMHAFVYMCMFHSLL